MTAASGGRALATTLLTVAALVACSGGDDGGGGGDPVAEGRRLFQGEATCSTCHGPDLEGTTMGPPLLDSIYALDHHPDAAIRAAVRNGVQPHHWDFGPMPALPHLDDDEIEAIIAYVRAEQETAAGTGPQR